MEKFNVKVLTATNGAKFQDMINDYVNELYENSNEVIDIKYQTTGSSMGSGVHVAHSALIIYK